MPLISILMPVYRGSACHLSASISSVLRSRCVDFELVVGFDGDPSRLLAQAVEKFDICHSRKVKVLKLPRKGLASTLNALIEASDSKYIARQDADDISLPSRLCRQLQVMDADCELGFCGTQIKRCDQFLKPFRFQRRYPIEFRRQLAYAAILNNPIAHPSLMIRRSVLGDVRYREIPNAEDWQLYIDLWRRGVRSCNLASVELEYRMHRAQVTAAQRDVSTLRRLQKESLVAAKMAGAGVGLSIAHLISQKVGLVEVLLSLSRR